MQDRVQAGALIENPQTAPDESMQAAVLFRSFRRELAAWVKTMEEFERPSSSADDARAAELFATQEAQYERSEESLGRLLLVPGTSKATIQLQMNAYCEYAAPHLYDKARFAFFTLLALQTVSRFAGLNTAEIDRLCATCRALCAALGAGAVAAGIF